MTLGELKKQIEAIKKNAEKEQIELEKKYALDHCDIRIGDILHDDCFNKTIIVEKITIRCMGKFNECPILCFYGQTLKKDLTPTKIINSEYTDETRCTLIKKHVPESEKT